MSDLGVQAQPLLVPILRGREVHEAGQRTLAAWAFKTAVMLEYTHPRGRTITESERLALYERHEAPSDCQIWIGAYDGTALNTSSNFGECETTDDRTRSRGSSVAASVRSIGLALGRPASAEHDVRDSGPGRHPRLDRFAVLALVASVIPPDWRGMTSEINRMDRLFLRRSNGALRMNRMVLRAMRATARSAPATFRRLSMISLDAPSRHLLGSSSSRSFSGPIAEGSRDPEGVLDDYLVLGSPWGFDPADLGQPVRIWQGDEVGMLPYRWAERLAERIPDAELRICPGQGHSCPSPSTQRFSPRRPPQRNKPRRELT